MSSHLESLIMTIELDPYLPDDASDEAVAQLIELLYEIARMLESRYAAQLLRYYRRPDPRQIDLWD